MTAMTTMGIAPTSPSQVRHRRLHRFRWALSDGVTVVRRDLGHVRHAPAELIATLLFPIIMIIVFGYTFGSAIAVPGGGNYREYLMPGLFVLTQVTAFGTLALAVADDAAKGVMDRFRSMPMSRLAVPFGRTGADIITGTLALTGMVVCGFAVGWRIRNGFADAVAGFALLILFRYSLSWFGAFLGMLVKNPKTADALMPLTFPITMLANTFVPTTGMPLWMQHVANWNPVSCTVAASRQLFGNPSYTTPHPAWPMAHPILASASWSVLLLVVFIPLTTWRFARAKG